MQNKQGTIEWFEVRAGKITASNFHKLVGNIGLTEIQEAEHKRLSEKSTLTEKQCKTLEELTDKNNNPKIPDTFQTYIHELIANEMGAMNDEVNTFALQYGTDMEPIAREYLCKALNIEVDEVGFVASDFDNELGYSADGIIKQGNRGLEIKCPLVVENHVKYMTIKNAADLKKIEPKYYWQIMFSMYCSGLKSWLFVSFNPKFKGANRMHCVNIDEDKKEFAFIKERVAEAKALRKQIKLKLEL